MKNAALGIQSGQRCECENVTGWETQPRIVRTLADTGVRCQAAGKMLGRDAPGPKKQIITVSPELPRNHSNHVDSNNGIKNVYHRTCLSYFERRRTRCSFFSSKTNWYYVLRLPAHGQRSVSAPVISYSLLRGGRKMPGNRWQVQQSKQLRMIAVG